MSAHHTDPGEAALSDASVLRAERLAKRTMRGLIETTDLAEMDTTLAGMFLLREVLAHLEVFADLAAKAACREIRHLTAERVAELRWADDEAAAAPSTTQRPSCVSLH